MSKIKSLEELKEHCAAVKERQAARRQEKIIVNVSLATCGIAAGGQKAMDAIRDEVSKLGLGGTVELMQSGCMTYCHSEPTVEITKPGSNPVVFGNVDEAKARALVTEYIAKGEPVDGVIPVNYVRVAF